MKVNIENYIVINVPTKSVKNRKNERFYLGSILNIFMGVVMNRR